jgi:hypothetical protein
MIDTRQLFVQADVVVIRENPDIVFWTWKAHKQVTAWLKRDERSRLNGTVGACTPTRNGLMTRGENDATDYI